MTPEYVIEMGKQAIFVLLLVSAPVLLAALITGLLVSIFQAATSINEATLSFIPKLVAMFATLIIAGPHSPGGRNCRHSRHLAALATTTGH